MIVSFGPGLAIEPETIVAVKKLPSGSCEVVTTYGTFFTDLSFDTVLIIANTRSEE